jgi:hypothetical protein
MVATSAPLLPFMLTLPLPPDTALLLLLLLQAVHVVPTQTGSVYLRGGASVGWQCWVAPAGDVSRQVATAATTGRLVCSLQQPIKSSKLPIGKKSRGGTQMCSMARRCPSIRPGQQRSFAGLPRHSKQLCKSGAAKAQASGTAGCAAKQPRDHDLRPRTQAGSTQRTAPTKASGRDRTILENSSRVAPAVAAVVAAAGQSPVGVVSLTSSFRAFGMLDQRPAGAMRTHSALANVPGRVTETDGRARSLQMTCT